MLAIGFNGIIPDSIRKPVEWTQPKFEARLKYPNAAERLCNVSKSKNKKDTAAKLAKLNFSTKPGPLAMGVGNELEITMETTTWTSSRGIDEFIDYNALLAPVERYRREMIRDTFTLYCNYDGKIAKITNYDQDEANQQPFKVIASIRRDTKNDTYQFSEKVRFHSRTFNPEGAKFKATRSHEFVGVPFNFDEFKVSKISNYACWYIQRNRQAIIRVSLRENEMLRSMVDDVMVYTYHLNFETEDPNANVDQFVQDVLDYVEIYNLVFSNLGTGLDYTMSCAVENVFQYTRPPTYSPSCDFDEFSFGGIAFSQALLQELRMRTHIHQSYIPVLCNQLIESVYQEEAPADDDVDFDQLAFTKPDGTLLNESMAPKRELDIAPVDEDDGPTSSKRVCWI